MTHGGARKGAGRPRTAAKRKLIGFLFDPATITLLHERIPPYKRSTFVEAAVEQALKKI